jgi:hypothetical protein
MSFFRDMGCESLVASGDHVRAIGWLHPDHPYTQGPVSAEFLGCLKEFAVGWGASTETLYFGVFLGLHTCEFCGKAYGVGNFGVPSGELLFVAPEMVVHYIEQHGYCPPPEFITAVLKSPLPDTEEYELITEPFWHKHREAVERMIQTGEASPGADNQL